ncbi:MAG: type II toxin-antitoxin system YafQ family toxin [Balneolaceae bacterium]|nr:MAG: type II toxin-antitoxin system YafQ family toxin [Balneolaceae bacterium]
MKTISRTTRFDKDVKKMKKRGKSFEIFKQVIEKLASVRTLEPKFKDHKLVGNYSGTRECHIEPDWLLIYITSEDELILVRTGSHADLFG